MKKLTDIEVMEKMVVLWNYLAQHPDKSKEEAYKVLGLPRDRSMCPCCAAASNFKTQYFFRTKCENCLLKNFWGGFCTGHDTAYVRWLDRDGHVNGSTSLFRTARAAREILKASQDKLKELEEIT